MGTFVWEWSSLHLRTAHLSAFQKEADEGPCIQQLHGFQIFKIQRLRDKSSFQFIGQSNVRIPEPLSGNNRSLFAGTVSRHKFGGVIMVMVGKKNDFIQTAAGSCIFEHSFFLEIVHIAHFQKFFRDKNPSLIRFTHGWIDIFAGHKPVQFPFLVHQFSFQIMCKIN